MALETDVDVGDAEIHDFDLAVVAQHDVAGLEIAMDDAFAVHVVEALGALVDHVDDLVGSQCLAAGDVFLQRHAVDELHHNVIQVVFLAGVVDADDRRVVHPPGAVNLGEECLAQLLARRRIQVTGRVRDLDCDGALHERVEGLIDDAHRAAADAALDLVLGDLGESVRWFGHTRLLS